MPQVTKQSPNNKSRSVAKGSSIFDRLLDVSEATQDEGIKMATIGRSGSGKTTLLATFPKPLLSIVASNSVAGETRSIKDVPGIKVHILQHEAELAELVAEQRRTGYFKTIGLDHVTGYSDLMLKRILNLEDVPAQMGWGTATQQQYGELGAGLKERLRDLLSLSCNVVINSQERESNTEGDKHEMLMPSVSFALTPSVAGWLGPAVDYLVYSFVRMGKVPSGKKIKVGGKEVDILVEEPEFCLRVGPHPVYATKFRVSRKFKLPDVITDPSYEKIAALIEGKPLKA